MDKQLKIGLFGFGCVGQGLHDVLNNSKGITADIIKICIKNPNKKRSLAASYFTTAKEDILNHPEINLVVELIDNADDAYEIVTTALKNGKHVVSANKKMIAEHLDELISLQKETGCALLYEASSCGSIPIIRTLEEYYDNEQLHSVQGIFNGSSNYILTKVANDGLDYNTALQEAQDLGFAETDPTLDVGGFDALYKLIILTAHSFGTIVKPENVLNYGIQNLMDEDIQYAKEKSKKIKQIARVYRTGDQKITLHVAPKLIDATENLAKVDYEFNGVNVEAAFSDKQFFQGKGAGGHPTGSAVLSDISASRYEYKYEYRKREKKLDFEYTTDVNLKIYFRYPSLDDLEKDKFETIIEKYWGPDHHYVIGEVALDKLINDPYFHQKDVFWAEID